MPLRLVGGTTSLYGPDDNMEVWQNWKALKLFSCRSILPFEFDAFWAIVKEGTVWLAWTCFRQAVILLKSRSESSIGYGELLAGAVSFCIDGAM